MKPLFNRLPGPEDIDLYLVFTNAEHRGNFLISFPFEIAKLHAATLLLRKGFYELLNEIDPIVLRGLLVGIR